MTNQDVILMEGTIAVVLPRDSFLAELENGSVVKAQKFQVELDNGNNVLAYLPVARYYTKILQERSRPSKV